MNQLILPDYDMNWKQLKIHYNDKIIVKLINKRHLLSQGICQLFIKSIIVKQKIIMRSIIVLSEGALFYILIEKSSCNYEKEKNFIINMCNLSISWHYSKSFFN